MNEVRVVLSVDWEGRELDDKNLEAMIAFREEFKEAATLHFLNAAYFTKKNANPELVRKKIVSVLRKGDEHGLHIHGWKSLFEKSDVSYRYRPSWMYEKPVPPVSDGPDCGHDVPISSYSVSELRSVIQYSLDVFKKYDFSRPFGFRAGGWMATKEVLEAIQKEGFLFDSSAVPSIFLKDKRKVPILHDWLESLWPDITQTTQPYMILEGPNPLWEIPDNGCLADYMTGDEMFWVFKQNWEALKDKKLKDNTITVSLGYHQETAAKYLPRLSDGLKKISKFCKREGISWRFGPLPLEI